MRLRAYIFGVLLLLLMPVYQGFGEIHLIEDGSTDYRVVVAPNATSIEVFAAQELQGYIMQMSNVFLPMDRRIGQVVEKRILVGGGAIDRLGIAVDKDYLGRDGFIIKTIGGNIILAGGRPRGTLYSVYTFLQMLGCRWLAPGILGEVIPQSLAITIDHIDHLERPSLRYRGFTSLIATNGEGAQWIDWMCKNRMNYILIPISNYANFKRILGGEVRRRNMDVGVSFDSSTLGGEVKLADRMLSFITKNQEVDIVVLELPEADADQYKVSVSEALKAIREQFPRKSVSLMTNGGNASAIGKNVRDGDFLSYFEPAPRCYRHSLSDEECEINIPIKSHLEEQLKAQKGVHIYEHYMGSYSQNSLPFPILHSIASDLKYFHRSTGLEGVVSQCEIGNWGSYALNYYVFARMAWNAGDDLGVIVDDYCEKYYGSASAPMKKYFAGLEDTVTRMEHFSYIDPPHLILSLLDEKSLAALGMELQNAGGLANGAMDFDRIRKTQLSLEHARLLWYTLSHYSRAIQFQEAEKSMEAQEYFQKAVETGEELITFLFKNVDEGVFIIPESYIFDYLEPLIMDARIRKEQLGAE